MLLSELLTDYIMDEDSPAAIQAKQLGLTSSGFGRWEDASGKVTHYTKDGKEWTGATHKMPKGPLMTGDPHNDDSEELFHKADLDEVADPSTVELVGALSIILGGSFGIKFGMDLLTKIV